MKEKEKKRMCVYERERETEREDRVHLDLLQKKKCTEKIISAKAQRK